MSRRVPVAVLSVGDVAVVEAAAVDGIAIVDMAVVVRVAAAGFNVADNTAVPT